LKFTEHGEVVISAKLASDSPQVDEHEVKIEFCVRDTGMGIPADRINSLFDSFTQADSSITRKHGGTGLGLAIARKLTGLMDGDIHVESEFGKGSSFIFTAVFRRQPQGQETRPVAPLDLRGLHILIIDDNKTAREILYSAVSSFKMVPEMAGSGKEALEMIKNQNPPYDLILVDWKMPQMNGLEIARYIKQKMNLSKTPKILMITAYGRSDLLSEADCSFLDAFLYKPINQSILFDTIVGIFKDESSSLPSLRKSRAMPESESDQPDLAGGKVLLAEDNEINQEIANEWLTSWNLEVIVANNGAEAVNLLRTENVDVVLMDMQMPVMDGYEATRKIRQELHLQQLPIIAMTAHALQGDREKCLEAGMNDYITKPIDPQLLLAALQIWMDPVQERISQSSPKQPGKSLTADFTNVKIPGISIESGLYKANHNQVLYQKLLRSFEKDFKDTADRIAEKIRQGQNIEARQLAHSIKGVSGNIGAQKLFDAARDVEDTIVAGQFTLDCNIWNDFSESLAEVIKGIGSFLTPAIQTETILPIESSISRNEMIHILERIMVLLEEDLVMARTLLEDNLSNLTFYMKAETIESINQSIDDFDIDSALLLLQATIKILEEKD
jgi:CheY-like chemotaxis protein/HPt (histidine-containing phosphotransfer) domain-containing protein